MLAGGKQRVAVSGDPQGVALHPTEDGLGQHDIVSGGGGDVAELEHDAAHRMHRDVEHVSAIDVEPAAELSQPCACTACACVDLEAGDLHVEARILLARAVDHQHVRPAFVGHESSASRRQASVEPGPLGRSTSGGADRRRGRCPSPVTSC